MTSGHRDAAGSGCGPTSLHGDHAALIGETVMPTLTQVVVWVIVGLIGGSLAGLLVTWKRRGFGFLRNLGMGLIGAFVGGLLFRLFGLFPRLDGIVISLRDILAACAGSLLVLVALWIWERSKRVP
jgi:uncharacterized membrane protein YeaQ/YmgE (transglycosylase-associated protein family)